MREGTRLRLETASAMNSVIAPTTMHIHSDWLVKETSYPPRCSGMSGLTANCSIGFIAKASVSVALRRHLGVQFLGRADYIEDPRRGAQHKKHDQENGP